MIPAALDPDDAEAVGAWRADVYSKIEAQAAYLCRMLDECPGLEVIWPEGGE